MENTNVNVNAPVVETVAAPAPAPVVPAYPIPAAPKKEKPDALTTSVGIFAILGVVETTGLVIYFGAKGVKKCKENIKAKKEAQAQQEKPKKPVEAASAKEPVKEEAPAAAE